MNVKLVDLLLDDVFKAVKRHLPCQISWQFIQIEGVGHFNLKKRVPFLYFFSRMKTIGELRYSVGTPYLHINIYSEDDFHSDNMVQCIRELEKDLNSRGYLKRQEITVNVGEKR